MEARVYMCVGKSGCFTERSIPLAAVVVVEQLIAKYVTGSEDTPLIFAEKIGTCFDWLD